MVVLMRDADGEPVLDEHGQQQYVRECVAAGKASGGWGKFWRHEKGSGGDGQRETEGSGGMVAKQLGMAGEWGRRTQSRYAFLPLSRAQRAQLEQQCTPAFTAARALRAKREAMASAMLADYAAAGRPLPRLHALAIVGSFEQASKLCLI